MADLSVSGTVLGAAKAKRALLLPSGWEEGQTKETRLTSILPLHEIKSVIVQLHKHITPLGEAMCD